MAEQPATTPTPTQPTTPTTTPATGGKPADTASDKDTSANGLKWFREIVTAIVGLVILTISIWMIGDTYISGSKEFIGKDETKIVAQEKAYGRRKDVLLLALGLLGTVTGYYFGRVPAELNAQNAQDTAKKAQDSASGAQAEAGKSTAIAAQATVERDQAKADKDKVKKGAITLARRLKSDIESLEPVRKRSLNEGDEDPGQDIVVNARAYIDAFLADLEE